jgi:hypothetical protein
VRRAVALARFTLSGFLDGLGRVSESGQNPDSHPRETRLSSTLCRSLGYLDPEGILLESAVPRRIPWRMAKKWRCREARSVRASSASIEELRANASALATLRVLDRWPVASRSWVVEVVESGLGF